MRSRKGSTGKSRNTAIVRRPEVDQFPYAIFHMPYEIWHMAKEWAHEATDVYLFADLFIPGGPCTAFGQKGCESDGEPHRYFLVLAGRKGTFYDNSGPAFPMLIKLDGERTQVEAVGIYSIQGKRMLGTVPEESYREFIKEPSAATDVMLRLEITSSQYERGLKVLRTWEKPG